MAQRLDWLDTVKAIGIFLVYIGHCDIASVYPYIYMFHMPLFFLISGFLFSLTNPVMENACTGKFVWKKTKRLIVPYVVLGTVIFGIKYLFAGLSHAAREFSVANFFKMFIIPSASYSTIGHLWYVFTLYVIFLMVLGLIAVRLLSADRLKLILVMAGLWLLCYFLPTVRLFNLSNVLYYAPYFIMGILLQRDYPKIEVAFNANGGGYNLS